jgi:hypothetical protein
MASIDSVDNHKRRDPLTALPLPQHSEPEVDRIVAVRLGSCRPMRFDAIITAMAAIGPVKSVCL